ncbi:MAG: hypothetical protein EON58_13620 [Alphaproteobacteria bacterium]|nr:MAG: hypothetical protein EON58_13620 [Alphaproteobacteria bacterium]
MEFLRAQFHEELNVEGDVTVLGVPFQRHEIIAGLDKDAYEEGFQNWLTARKTRLLEQVIANNQFFKQEYRFDKLRAIVRGGSLVPFVGAGMSMPSGYPGWTPFLEQLRSKSSIPEAEFQASLDLGDYEGAAQTLYDDLGAAAFNERLQSTYEREIEIVGPVLHLPSLFRRHVITTNFDTVLENVYKGHEQGFDSLVLGSGLGEANRLALEGGRLLIKVHGTCSQVSERVLLASEYRKAYDEGGHVKRFFSRFLAGHVLLFVGCRLTVDRTIKEMQNVVGTDDESEFPRHYAIVELQNGDDQIGRERELSKANIFPIWYPDGQHEYVEAFLIALMEKR